MESQNTNGDDNMVNSGDATIDACLTELENRLHSLRSKIKQKVVSRNISTKTGLQMCNQEEILLGMLPRWAASLYAGLDFYYGHALCSNFYSAHNCMPNLIKEAHTPHLVINRGWIEGDSYNPRVNWQVIAPYCGGDFLEFVLRRPKNSVIFGCEGNPYIKITRKGSKTVAIGKKGSR